MQDTRHGLSEETLTPQEFERRLKRLFDAVDEAGDGGIHRSPGPWFAQHRLVDLTRKQVYNYMDGTTPVPGRIVAVLELLEEQYGVSHD